MSTKHLNRNKQGEPVQAVSMTLEQMDELIALIDDEPVDEEFLKRIRALLNSRRNRLRKALAHGNPYR